MNLVLFSSLLVLFGHQFCQISADSDQRTERQSPNYEFPGVRKAQYEELIEQYDPTARVAAAQTYSPSVADPSEYSGAAYRPSSSSRSRPTYRTSKEEDDAKRAEEEEEKKPDRLALLLADSKFQCDDKKDGYYADETVGCQVFHYCVAGAKHSWQCPENTVFHQIHLNCVPAAQDICTQSSKFHIVNDYLHKPLDQRGPNNTVRYHQRFYPEGFDWGGDVLSQVLPQGQPQRPAQRDSYNSYRDSDDSYEPRGNSRSNSDSYSPSYSSYPAPAPVRSQPSRPVYKPSAVRSSPPSYSAPSYSTSQPKPTPRPVSYSTPSIYSTSYSDDSDSDSDSYDSYPSSASGYSPSPSVSSSSYSAPSSSSYSAPSSSSYSAPTSGYPSSSYSGSLASSYPSSSAGSSASLSSYRPVQAVQAKPAAYPSRSIGIPIASFRVSSPAQSYGSSAQASRLTSAAYLPSPARFSLGAFTSEMASGVKYDEDY